MNSREVCNDIKNTEFCAVEPIFVLNLMNFDQMYRIILILLYTYLVSDRLVSRILKFV